MTFTENMQGSEFKRKLMFAQVRGSEEKYKEDKLLAFMFIAGLLAGATIVALVVAYF